MGEFANMMVRNYDEPAVCERVFQMDYKLFIAKYFKGNRKDEINRNITPEKYHQFCGAFQCPAEIIDNDTSKYIVWRQAGSGKTKCLCTACLADLLET